MAGEIVRQWYATGRYRDRAPPKGGIPVEAETFHHGVNLGPDGNMLLLSMEIREYDDWPGSVTDPNAPRERAKVVGDIVMEVRPDGSKANEWRMLDLLDPYRITYGSRANYWGVRGYPGTMDWCHANGTCYDAARRFHPGVAAHAGLHRQVRPQERTRCAGSSARMATGGSRGRTSCSSRTPRWRGNSISTTARSRRRARSCASTTAITAHSRLRRRCRRRRAISRAVEFAVDEANGTVRQVWSYGEAPGERIYAGFQGGAMRLPKTGNTFITYGGVCSIDGRPASGPDRFDPGEADLARQARHLRAAPRGDAGPGGRARSADRRRARRPEGAVGVPLRARAGVTACPGRP